MDTKTFNVSIAMLGLTALQLFTAQQVLINSDPQSLSANTVMLVSLAGVQIALYIVGFILLKITLARVKKDSAKNKAK